ncbi:MAG: septum formation initiator family protein [Bacilli bacterium]|nr:septum formation initiator family protein [Bacilli bacterium]
MSKNNRLLRIVLIVVIIMMIYSIGNQFVTTIKTKIDLNNAKQTNQKLKDESTRLDNEIIKLKDKNYIQTYVSGTIFSTEKGTSIYVLPEDKTSGE